MYKTNLLSKCLYSNAGVILLVVGSIACRRVDLRRTEEERSSPTCDHCCDQYCKLFWTNVKKRYKG